MATLGGSLSAKDKSNGSESASIALEPFVQNDTDTETDGGKWIFSYFLWVLRSQAQSMELGIAKLSTKISKRYLTLMWR